LLGALGVAFGAISLWFPFGRDQGLYAYVGREWLQHGSIPYLHTFEQKTPAVFLLHALSVAIFGDTMAGIRVLELVATAMLGVLCAELARPIDRKRTPGMIGAGIVVANVLYYGFFTYWDTAQCELPCGVAAIASLWAVERIRSERRAYVVGGVLAGIAFVTKPPVAALLLVTAWAAARRALRHRTTVSRESARDAGAALGWTALGAAVAPSVLFFYFAAHHALDAAKDVLVGANGYYVAHEKGFSSLAGALEQLTDRYDPRRPVVAILTVALVAIPMLGDMPRAERWWRASRSWALLLAAFAGVAVQQKFFPYHWSLFVGPLALLATSALDGFVATHRRGALRLAAAIAVFGAGYAVDWYGARQWGSSARAVALYATGRMDRERFLDHFPTPPGPRLYDAEQVGIWLYDHTTPEETVAVRGFDPEMYITAHRRYGCRFFWTLFLTMPSRAYRRPEFLAEDRACVETTLPAYVVATTSAHDGPDSPEWFAAWGYHAVFARADFTVMARGER
jgi:4-amino-4-deoxy-L-arabinose transferase-like glycosyltransferase